MSKAPVLTHLPRSDDSLVESANQFHLDRYPFFKRTDLGIPKEYSRVVQQIEKSLASRVLDEVDSLTALVSVENRETAESKERGPCLALFQTRA